MLLELVHILAEASSRTLGLMFSSSTAPSLETVVSARLGVEVDWQPLNLSMGWFSFFLSLRRV